MEHRKSRAILLAVLTHRKYSVQYFVHCQCRGLKKKVLAAPFDSLSIPEMFPASAAVQRVRQPLAGRGKPARREHGWLPLAVPAAERGGGASCGNNKASSHQDACLPWRSVCVWV